MSHFATNTVSNGTKNCTPTKTSLEEDRFGGNDGRRTNESAYFQLVLEAVAQMPGARSINVCIDKKARCFEGKRGHDVYETAWTFMLQRFHNYIQHNRVQGGTEYGMVIHDQGHEIEIRKLMRKLRVHNPVPSQYGGGSRNIPMRTLIEDPISRYAHHAQFIQLCDYLAYALLRREEPNPKYPGLSGVFQIAQPIALRDASPEDPNGIVRYPKTIKKAWPTGVSPGPDARSGSVTLTRIIHAFCPNVTTHPRELSNRLERPERFHELVAELFEQEEFKPKVFV